MSAERTLVHVDGATTTGSRSQLRLAYAFGYRVHRGGPEDGELSGRWWWTLTQPGWSGVEVDSGHHPTRRLAWASAIKAHTEEMSS